MISTFFSVKLHGLDMFAGSGLSNEIGQGMYHFANQSANLGIQNQ